MKSAINFLVLILGLLPANFAHADPPREQLQQMVEQLQKTPNDNALREKIIRLAPTLKPSPALPDAAVTFEGRAQFAFRSAKSEDDYLAAAREYEKAVAAAPWVLGYYADLCTIYEKADKFEDAKRHCGFYLIGLTDPAQMTDVKRRIAGLEFGIEKASSPQAREAELLQKVEGARFVLHTNAPEARTDDIYEIRDRTLVHTYRIYFYATPNLKYGKGPAPGDYIIGRGSYRDGAFYLASDHAPDFTQLFKIRPDGQALVAIGGFYNSNPNDRSFGFQSMVISRE